MLLPENRLDHVPRRAPHPEGDRQPFRRALPAQDLHHSAVGRLDHNSMIHAASIASGVPAPLPGLSRGVPARVLLKDPRAVPVVLGQAVGGDRDPAGRGRARRSATLPDERYLRRRWSQHVKRVYEVDPRVCPRCGGDLPAGRQGCAWSRSSSTTTSSTPSSGTSSTPAVTRSAARPTASPCRLSPPDQAAERTGAAATIPVRPFGGPDLLPVGPPSWKHPVPRRPGCGRTPRRWRGTQSQHSARAGVSWFGDDLRWPAEKELPIPDGRRNTRGLVTIRTTPARARKAAVAETRQPAAHQATGFAQRISEKRAKSVSADMTTSPYSMASAASWASVIMLARRS